jgi:hypothetical protein
MMLSEHTNQQDVGATVGLQTAQHKWDGLGKHSGKVAFTLSFESMGVALKPENERCSGILQEIGLALNGVDLKAKRPKTRRSHSPSSI